MNDRSRRARGRWGEDRACHHLRRLGYRVLDRNWRSPEREVGGELDVIASIEGTIVFCEVKARRSAGYGGAAAAVGPSKQERIRALALSWLREHSWLDRDVRFDVITIEGVTLTHFESAF
jgi:putative endonuclease